MRTSSPPLRSDQPFRFSLRRLFCWMFCLCLTLAVVSGLGRAIRDARRAAIASSSQGSLNQLLLALMNYHDHYGQLPPAYLADPDGTPMHSWRVLILPYVEESALFESYDFSEPWNGPNNSKLATQMPAIFNVLSEPPSNSFTNIVAITGPGTAFPGSSSTRISEFRDGLANTILLTEIANSNVPWLQPCDLAADSIGESGLGMSAVHWRRPFVVFGDSIRVYAVQPDIPPEDLKALTTIAGGEPITRAALVEQGYLK